MNWHHSEPRIIKEIGKIHVFSLILKSSLDSSILCVNYLNSCVRLLFALQCSVPRQWLSQLDLIGARSSSPIEFELEKESVNSSKKLPHVGIAYGLVCIGFWDKAPHARAICSFGFVHSGPWFWFFVQLESFIDMILVLHLPIASIDSNHSPIINIRSKSNIERVRFSQRTLETIRFSPFFASFV